MDFARRQLEKYGWTDGKGLGKHENGISEALKPKLKRSVTGVGHDAASDFTEHWWSQLYDKAAGNVQVEEVNGKTKRIKAKDADNFEITNSTWRLSKKKKANNDEEYSEYFVRKAVLTSGGSKVVNINASDSDEEVVKKDVFKMTDEELFAACEGRTAHKGARHGLKAVGKLARIAQQEAALLKQPQFVDYSHSRKIVQDLSTTELNVVENMNLESDTDMSVTRKKKKKRRKNIVLVKIITSWKIMSLLKRASLKTMGFHLRKLTKIWKYLIVLIKMQMKRLVKNLSAKRKELI
ncbi:G patch domain-containing protein 4 [Galleria mellonella]|uniref:G patch domain-containing protein 4 n=1 Tax=Galleria mellonella TaxID=7137 RepID=A0A6J1WM58_GALME|nr:G patch domain-containing protein 4 [Galleria mellonella]